MTAKVEVKGFWGSKRESTRRYGGNDGPTELLSLITVNRMMVFGKERSNQILIGKQEFRFSSDQQIHSPPFVHRLRVAV
jgi:hypothetical protein